MSRDIDSLVSGALKHVRDRWWDARFTEFLRDAVHAGPGSRVLDVGCGVGTAEAQLGELGLSGARLVAVDVEPGRAREALRTAAAHGVRAGVASADVQALPFAPGTFDAAFCVAVLQHVADVRRALDELVRVLAPGGRLVAVEPDNDARYCFSSLESGHEAFARSRAFWRGLAVASGDRTDPSIGPRLPVLMCDAGLQPVSIRVFPVAITRLGAPVAETWAERRQAIERAVADCGDDAVKRRGHDLLHAVDRYARDADAAGPRFVEIQHTMLVATTGQKI